MTALQFRGHAGRSCRTRYLARKYDFRPRISSSLGRGPSSQRRNDCASPNFRPPEPPRRPPPPATLTCTTPPLEPEPVNSPPHHQVKLSANVHTVVGGRRYHLVQSDASLLSPTGETHSQQHAFVFGTSSPEISETPPPFAAPRRPSLLVSPSTEETVSPSSPSFGTPLPTRSPSQHSNAAGGSLVFLAHQRSKKKGPSLGHGQERHGNLPYPI